MIIVYVLSCGENDIVKLCKLSRLRWAGHVIRQDDDDLSKRVLLSESGGRHPRGRPKLRWEDGVVEDVARLGCRNWKVVALHREGWRKLLKEAEAHPGLQRRWRERVYVLSTEDTKITMGSVEHNNSFMQYKLNKTLRHVLEEEVIKIAQ
jgi:hypothetical protein